MKRYLKLSLSFGFACLISSVLVPQFCERNYPAEIYIPRFIKEHNLDRDADSRINSENNVIQFRYSIFVSGTFFFSPKSMSFPAIGNGRQLPIKSIWATIDFEYGFPLNSHRSTYLIFGPYGEIRQSPAAMFDYLTIFGKYRFHMRCNLLLEAINLLVLSMVCYGILAVFAKLTSGRRSRGHLCQQCGYPSIKRIERCPECGSTGSRS